MHNNLFIFSVVFLVFNLFMFCCLLCLSVDGFMSLNIYKIRCCGFSISSLIISKQAKLSIQGIMLLSKTNTNFIVLHSLNYFHCHIWLTTTVTTFRKDVPFLDENSSGMLVSPPQNEG